jgi:hypothetical protein
MLKNFNGGKQNNRRLNRFGRNTESVIRLFHEKIKNKYMLQFDNVMTEILFCAVITI